MPNCGLSCRPEDDLLFNETFRHRARFLVGTSAILCVVSTLFTLLTFVVDPDRFRYPERPIIFLSACYLGVGTAYVVGFALGDQTACSGPFPSGTASDGSTGVSFSNGEEVKRFPVSTQGTSNALCTVVFGVQYFFAIAAAVWWTVLAVAWFLSAGPKWGREAIERRSGYFHLVAWAAPAILTFSAIGTGSVVGDPVSGICVVGGGLLARGVGPVSAEQAFVLAPLIACLGVGSLFLAAGFISLLRVRSAMQRDGTRTDKLEQLMLRIGVFGVLYAVPATIVVVCHAYEQSLRADWIRKWYAKACRVYSVPCFASRDSFIDDQSASDFTVLILRYVMTLIVGVASGFWVWSGKTVSSWKTFSERLCRSADNSSGVASGRAVHASINVSSKAGKIGHGRISKPAVV